MKMQTFVECYDNETNEEDEVVIVPFEKPAPPLIVLGETDNESTCSQPASPEMKRRRIGDADDIQPEFEIIKAIKVPAAVVDQTTSEPTPKQTRKSSKRKKQSKEKISSDEDEDWDWNMAFDKDKTRTSEMAPLTPLKQWEGSVPEPSTSFATATPKSSSSKQVYANDSPSTPATKAFRDDSREEFIRFAASLGLPVLTPESQEELMRHGPPDLSEVLAIGTENIQNKIDTEEEEDDCIIIEDEEEKLLETRARPSAADSVEGVEAEPLNDTNTTADTESELSEPSPCPPPAHTSNRSVFPPTWTSEMQHFYGDERPNFSMTNIKRNQSRDGRLWVVREDGHSHNNRKRHYILCNNCQQRGHRVRECPEKIKGSICWMCGEHGDHQVERCPKKMCLNCGGHSKQFQYPCRNCETSNHRYSSVLINKCAICDMEGHLDGRCPDNWRRFHSTTATLSNEMVRTSENGVTKATSWKVHNNGKCEYRRKNKSSCANCGRKGHNYFQCKGNRANVSYFINTPFVIHELSKAELEELEHLSATIDTKADGARRVAQDDLEAPRLPNFDPKTERIVTLNQNDYDLLRDGYEQKMPTALLFFSCHIHNIIKIIPREKTMDIHLNGANEKSVANAKRNLLNALTKLKVAKGLVDMEHASVKNLPPPTSEGFQFLIDTIGDSNNTSRETLAANVLIRGDFTKSKPVENADKEHKVTTCGTNDLYLKTVLSQMVPNPLFGQEFPKPDEVLQPLPPADTSAGRQQHESDAETDDDGFLEQKEEDKVNREHAAVETKEVEPDIEIFQEIENNDEYGQTWVNKSANRDEYCQNWVNGGAKSNRSTRFHSPSSAAQKTITFGQQCRDRSSYGGPGGTEKRRKDNVRYPDAEYSKSFYPYRKPGKNTYQSNTSSRSSGAPGTPGSGRRSGQASAQPKPRAQRYFD